MRVLQLGKYYYPHMGGIESHLHSLCGELKDRVDLEVVVCNTAPRTVREVVGGISVTRCAEIFSAASTSICPTMPWELSRRDYDLLHLHFPHPMGVMSYLAGRKPSSHGLVITYHSDIVRQETLLRLFRPFMHRAMARADVILCTSPDYLDSSPDLRPYRSKCRCIPYGIDLSQFARTARQEAAAAEIRARYPAPLLVAVGRLVYYKGFEYLVRAMRGIAARLLLIGDGPLRSSLEALARECGVADRVYFLGEIHNEEIIPYYLASEVFVLPSVARSEAFGIVQLEAMACGLPVVNTRLDSGVPFVSKDGESGLTVEPKDPEALAGAIGRLLADPELRRRYGTAARRRVETEFSKELMASRVHAAYLETQDRRQA